MSTRSFAGTLAFGLLAGLAFPGFALLTSPLLTTSGALGFFLSSGAIGYAALLGAGWRERAKGALIASAFVLPTALFLDGVGALAMAAALAVAVARARLLGGQDPVRTLATEGGLALAGFGFVAALRGPDWPSISLALWAWFLVQSVYFMIEAGSPDPDAGEVDAFDLATREIVRILDGD